MVMTHVPHVGANAYDTHGHLWTVTGWQLVNNMIHIARDTFTGIAQDAAVSDNGQWHIIGEPANTLRFNPDDYSRKTFEVTNTVRPVAVPLTGDDHRRAARNAAVNMSRLGIESGGVFFMDDHPGAVPRVTVNLAGLQELIERARKATPRPECAAPGCKDESRPDGPWCDGHDR